VSAVQPQLKFWRGYVTLKLTGKQMEGFINLTTAHNLQLWDIQFKSKEAAEFSILLHDFFRLRPLLRKTSCKIHVMGRFGAPFFLDKLSTRKFLMVGMFLFAAALFLLSSVIWQVKVVGNEQIDTAYILEIAKQQGIHPWQWKFKIKNAEDLARELHRQLPSVSWVGVQFHGTRLTIEIVESAEPEAKPLLNPRHLIASTSAIVTKIIAEKGNPMVKTHAYVRKGDLLISGLIGSEPNQQTVVAKGSVIGEVWYTSKVEVPLVIKNNTYTGESANRFYLVFGSRALQITGYRQKEYQAYTLQSVRKSLHWRNWALPIGWIQETRLESQILLRKQSHEEAIRVGMERAQVSILKETGPDSRLIEQKILHERLENGKVYIEAHFEIEQSIVQEQPIIQGE
jgi:similar to stage IV sporulation protein